MTRSRWGRGLITGNGKIIETRWFGDCLVSFEVKRKDFFNFLSNLKKNNNKVTLEH